MALAELVPVAEQAFDVADLGDALAIGGVVRSPVRQGIDVEIGALKIDALGVDQGFGMF
jgi:hypothetical protein